MTGIVTNQCVESAVRDAADRAGLDAHADSAGTAAYHIGEPPDPRSISTAARHGVDIGAVASLELRDDLLTESREMHCAYHDIAREIAVSDLSMMHPLDRHIADVVSCAPEQVGIQRPRADARSRIVF